MPNFQKILYISCLTSCLMIASRAEGQKSYFYKGFRYGSQALYNPVSLILNGGYGILQYDGYRRDVLDLPYREGAHNIWGNLSDPFDVISRYGWSDFAAHEVFPLSLNKKGAQWLPNYKLHLIGGGMSYRMMYEWYEQHHFRGARLLSIVTMGGYHYLNEVVENGDYIGDNVDPIADMYIFDVAGVTLFSFEGVCKFFGEELNLSDWSLMPSFDLEKFTIQNQGQNFSVRWKPPISERWRLFYYFGNLGLSGLSYSTTDSTSVSFAVGARARTRYVVDEETHRQTVELVWTCGFFYDKNNSLMFSFMLGGMHDKRMNMNIYPDLLHIGKFSPGILMNADSRGKLMFGVTTIWTPGVAIR